MSTIQEALRELKSQRTINESKRKLNEAKDTVELKASQLAKLSAEGLRRKCQQIINDKTKSYSLLIDDKEAYKKLKLEPAVKSKLNIKKLDEELNEGYKEDLKAQINDLESALRAPKTSPKHSDLIANYTTVENARKELNELKRRYDDLKHTKYKHVEEDVNSEKENKPLKESSLYDKVMALASRGKKVAKSKNENLTEAEDGVVDNPELLDAPVEDEASVDVETTENTEDTRTDEEIFLDYLVANFDEKQVEKACKALDIEVPEEQDNEEDNTEDSDDAEDDEDTEDSDELEEGLEEDLGDIDADGDLVDTSFNFEKEFARSN